MRYDPRSTRADVIADIARRVRPAVPEMPEAEFQAMVARMADIEMRHRERVGDGDWTQVTPPLGVPRAEREQPPG